MKLRVSGPDCQRPDSDGAAARPCVEFAVRGAGPGPPPGIRPRGHIGPWQGCPSDGDTGAPASQAPSPSLLAPAQAARWPSGAAEPARLRSSAAVQPASGPRVGSAQTRRGGWGRRDH